MAGLVIFFFSLQFWDSVTNLHFFINRDFQNSELNE